MEPPEILVDLHDRLARAAGNLADLAHVALVEQEWETHARLSAKREGVMLAFDYLRGYDDPTWCESCNGPCRDESDPPVVDRPSIKERPHEFVVTNITPGRCGSCGEHVDDAPHVGRNVEADK